MSLENDEHLITLETVSPTVKRQTFAPTGPIVLRALEIQKELREGVKKPFTELIRTNFGDPHGMGQKPMTFLRQVLALASYPKLLDDPDFPDDAKQRAKDVLESIGGSLGIYSPSRGIDVVRKQAAKYIGERDGIPANYEDIIIGNGTSDVFKSLLRFLMCEINGKTPGLFYPYPQYPLYALYAKDFDVDEYPYYSDEDNNWALDIAELQRIVNEARQVCHPRVIIITNPGNPTGQVLSRQNIEDVIKFAYKEKILIVADEVYQGIIYDENCQFHSFRKVAAELGPPYSKVELASLMSVSKDVWGECGFRSGYVEVTNLTPEVKELFHNNLLYSLCPNNGGQVTLYAALNPPRPGESSYELYNKEKNEILNNLKIRAKFIEKMFNTLEGFHCNPVQGAFYTFPSFTPPPKAIEEAKKKNMTPDTFYCYELLENTGICVIPGDGFGQKPGTHHFRTTILPSIEKLKIVEQKFKEFHTSFMRKYR